MQHLAEWLVLMMCVRHKISTRTELSRSRAAQFKEIRSLSRPRRSLPAGLPSGLPKRTHRQTHTHTHRQAGSQAHTHAHTGTRCSLHSSICCLSVCESERQTLRGCFSHRIQQWPLTQTQAHTHEHTPEHTHEHTHERTQAQTRGQYIMYSSVRANLIASRNGSFLDFRF